MKGYAVERSRSASRLSGTLLLIHDMLEQRAAWGIAVITAFYLVSIFKIAATKPLWTDEIITRFLVALRPADLIRALKAGTDGQPPLFYFLAGLAGRTGSALGLRLPSIVGMWVAGLCLYVFIARRGSRVCGLFAMLLPFLLGSGAYAYDARPYGLLVGATAGSILCWQAAADGTARYWTVPLLWATATLAVSVSYFGTFILIPLGVAEVIRWCINHKADLAMWSALALAAIPLAVEYPIIRSLRGSWQVFWAPVTPLGSLGEFYLILLEPAWMIGVGLFLTGLALLFRQNDTSTQKPLVAQSAPELALVISFAALPVLYVVAGLRTGAFVPRYAIVGVIGIALGAAYLAARDRTVATVCVLLAAAQFALLERWQFRFREMPKAIHLSREISSESWPIVMSGPNEFLETTFYAPAELATRLTYIAEPALALRYVKTDSVDLTHERLARVAQLNIRRYAAFVASNPRFFVIQRKGEPFGWLLNKLRDDGALITLREFNGNEVLYDVKTRLLNSNIGASGR